MSSSLREDCFLALSFNAWECHFIVIMMINDVSSLSLVHWEIVVAIADMKE